MTDLKLFYFIVDSEDMIMIMITYDCFLRKTHFNCCHCVVSSQNLDQLGSKIAPGRLCL